VIHNIWLLNTNLWDYSNRSSAL